VKDGTKLRLAGKGSPGARGGPAGDLYVTVRVRSHALFGRTGTNFVRTDGTVVVWTENAGYERGSVTSGAAGTIDLAIALDATATATPPMRWSIDGGVWTGPGGTAGGTAAAGNTNLSLATGLSSGTHTYEYIMDGTASLAYLLGTLDPAFESRRHSR